MAHGVMALESAQFLSGSCELGFDEPFVPVSS